MSNNQSRATTALTFSMPPSVNPMPKLQTVEPYCFAATIFSGPYRALCALLEGTYRPPRALRGGPLSAGSWWSRPSILFGRLLVEPTLILLSSRPALGGADRDRTGDLLLAKQALSQLSYGPGARGWWVWLELNQRPPPYQDGALTN